MVRYRADVDGLRAVAVLSVLLFHSGVRGAYGGFVGVDVFFVISGFLITSILHNGMEAGNFSIAEFYKRRVHRIFPALFALMAVVVLVGALVLLPSELEKLGASVIGTSLFVSNILFYLQSGYFNTDSAVKPLLHTWSLAVEEQFYIFWPLAMITARRLRIKATYVAAVVAAASLAFSLWQIHADPSGDFFLLPSRAWEPMLGALLALGAVPPLPGRALREAAAAVGLLLILTPVHFFTAATPFPGSAALLPCLGAALMIHAGGCGPTAATRLLSLPPVRGLGLISYSLYLWHWPIIVFARIGLYLKFDTAVTAGVLGASFAAAILSWMFIEQPFQRSRPRLSRRRSLLTAAGAMAIACCIGAGVLLARGLPPRFTPAQQNVATFLDYDGDAAYRGGSCFLSKPTDRFDPAKCLKPTPGEPSVVLIGDSHAAHLWPGLNAEGRGFTLLQATSAGCKPLLGPQPGAVARCTDLMMNMLERTIPRLHPAAIILAARWRETDAPRLPQTLRYLKGFTGRLVLVGPVPQYVTALPRLLVSAQRRGDPTLITRSQDPEPTRVDKALRQIAAASGVTYVSLRDVLCEPACQTLAPSGIPLQFDYGHFTAEGSAVVAPAIISSLGLVHQAPAAKAEALKGGSGPGTLHPEARPWRRLAG